MFKRDFPYAAAYARAGPHVGWIVELCDNQVQNLGKKVKECPHDGSREQNVGRLMTRGRKRHMHIM